MNRQEYLDRIAHMTKKTRKPWCATHPTGFVGTNQFGAYYPTCAVGHREGLEKCDLRFPEEVKDGQE